jgi:hypothetical protein
VYGDTATLRQLAHQMNERAGGLRCCRQALGDQIRSTPWTGQAAGALRAVAESRLAQLDRCVHRHEEAARALARHAEEVDRLKALIASLEHRARDVVTGPLGHLLDHFVAPPTGHLDWLRVDLPGLGR